MKEARTNIAAVDLFCGIGGLTHGLIKEGINVVAGVDIDPSCKFAYEVNNNAIFVNKSVTELSAGEIKKFYPEGHLKILVGCAPCQTFSTHTQKIKNRSKDERWNLLYSFLDIIENVKPHVISMENVPQLKKYRVFQDFVEKLYSLGYKVTWKIVNCSKYGMPQNRRRLVLLASFFGEIELIPPTHNSSNFKTVRSAIGNLEPIKDGEVSKRDPLHRTWNLSPINKERIKQSKQGGTWKDWDPSLRAKCHNKESGKTYSAVYARMNYNKPSPTITTQFYSFGTGRFGHPTQDRALSLREGALLQTFPKYYKLLEHNQPISFNKLGTHIGNAVPINLGRVIGKSIIKHLEEKTEKQAKLG